MKYYIIAGEASGDLHASNLMKALKNEDAEFRFFGGDLMEAVGGTLVRHYREMAFMGVIPVLLHWRTILRNMRVCREDILAYRPDAVILVDYPGFNLKIAKFVKTKLRLPVYYYISPKIWAWKMYRIKAIRRYVDRMFCILPFEVNFYKSLDYRVDYVGNPSVDSVFEYTDKRRHSVDSVDAAVKNPVPQDRPVIAVLAGSRRDEIRQNLPAMLRVASQFPEYKAIIAGAPGLTADDYAKYASPQCEIVFGQTYDLLSQASVAMVTSGTATLETALFRIPQVVCYYFGGGRVVNCIFRRFFHVQYISLVNLIADDRIVRELFGSLFTFRNIHDELRRLIYDESYRAKMIAGYERVISILGAPGAASRTAQLIVNTLKS
jgi:lipid-A-disaccharide synthase